MICRTVRDDNHRGLYFAIGQRKLIVQFFHRRTGEATLVVRYARVGTGR